MMLLYILPKYSSFFPVEYSSSYKVFFSINNYYKNSRSVKIKCNYSEKQKIIEQNDQTDEIYKQYDYQNRKITACL